MKSLSMTLALLGGVLPLHGGEVAPRWDVEIPPPVLSKTPAPPISKPEPIYFKVLSSHTTRVDVVEAPEMHDLPPITGTINVTVQLVKDPGVTDPPPPLPPLPPGDPAVIARLAALREKYRGSELVCKRSTEPHYPASAVSV